MHFGCSKIFIPALFNKSLEILFSHLSVTNSFDFHLLYFWFQLINFGLKCLLMTNRCVVRTSWKFKFQGLKLKQRPKRSCHEYVHILGISLHFGLDFFCLARDECHRMQDIALLSFIIIINIKANTKIKVFI